MIEKRLAELTLSITDGKHGDCTDEMGSGYYFISCKDIYNDSINYGGARQIRKEDFIDTHKRTKLEPQDILITNSGTIGRMAYVLDNPKIFHTTFQKSVAILKPNTEVINSKYLYYAIKNSINRLILKSEGTAQKNLLLSTLREFKLDIEKSIPLQKKYAAVLFTYDQLIENNTRRIALLEKMAQELYKEWFVRFRFPGHEHVKMANGVPEGWTICNLSELYSTSSGGTPSRNNPSYYVGSIPWIKTGELQDTYILETEEHINNEAIMHSSAKLIQPNSLLIAMYAGENVGKMGINVMLSTCNQACCVLNEIAGYSLEYLYHYLKLQRTYLQSISFGAAQQNISQDIIKKMKLVKPTRNIVIAFTKLVAEINNAILCLAQKNQNLTKQRNLLLPRLMSGKLELP